MKQNVLLNNISRGHIFVSFGSNSALTNMQVINSRVTKQLVYLIFV